MSRIGKKTIVLNSGIDVQIKDPDITVKGPKGILTYTLPKGIVVEKNDKSLLCKRDVDTPQQRAYHGLVRSLLNNMVIGVEKGFTKTLEIVGVGYRAKMEGNSLVLSIGFSHPVVFPVPDEINIQVQGNNVIIISGIDKQKVGHVAAKIRDYYPPEPYKGKGIKYSNEIIRRKAGKSVSKK